MILNGPTLNLLFIGDIVGKGGRKAVKALVPQLKQQYMCTFVVANGENCAAGAGLNKSCLGEMADVVDVFTSGDHTWDRKEFEDEIRGMKNVVRPANMSKLQPGRGWLYTRNPAGGEVAVISLMGKVFMKDSAYCPFETAEQILTQIPITCKCIIVDIHAEATSEKAALAWFLDGRVTAVLGTHTHVQTADARILPGGTAFLSDVGMVGAADSILGRSVPDVIEKFRTGMPHKFPVVETGIRLDAAVIRYDMQTGRAVEIKPISVMYDPDTQSV